MARAQTIETGLLMPKASAVWLVENTILTFKQIATFTGLGEIEVEALADGDIGRGLVGRNPIDHSELTQAELDRCQADPEAALVQSKSDLPAVKSRAKGPRYTPVSKRGDKPDAIAYIIKNNPEITDAQLSKLIGTTKPTINNVRERTHPNSPNIRPRHPADLGLCTYAEFEKAVEKGLKAQGKDPEKVKAEREAAAKAAMMPEETTNEDADSSSFDFSNFLTSGMNSGSNNTSGDD